MHDIDASGGAATVSMIRGACRCSCAATSPGRRIFGGLRLAGEHFGRLDIAFNNAGIGDEDLFADEAGKWARIIDIDLTAVIDATRIAVKELKRGGHGGAIVNTASLIGLGPFSLAAGIRGGKSRRRELFSFARSSGERSRTFA